MFRYDLVPAYGAKVCLVPVTFHSIEGWRLFVSIVKHDWVDQAEVVGDAIDISDKNVYDLVI